MADKRYLRRHQDELNKTNAVITPICIVVDRSGSMGQFKDESGMTRMERLNEGIRMFIKEIRDDDMLADSVEISIIGFADDSEEILKFSTIDNIGDINITNSNRAGDTPLGVEKALSVLEDEKQILKDNKSKYNQPWIVIFSDGRATLSAKCRKDGEKSKDFFDIKHRLRVVQQKTKDLERNKKLTVIPVLISEPDGPAFDKGYEEMKGFSVENRALVLCKDSRYNPKNYTFKDFFKILSKSVSVSNADLVFGENSNNRKIDNDVRYNPNDYIKKEQAERYLRVDNDKSVEKSNNNVKLFVLLPEELDSNECLMISYQPFGYEIYSDTSNEVSFDSNTAIVTIKLENGINDIRLNIGICEKKSHRLIMSLDNSSYTISGSSLIVDLSSRLNIKKSEIEQIRQEAQNDNQVSGNTVDDSFEEEAAKPLQKVKTKVDTPTADDDYLNKLLNGMDDWDNI